MPVLESRIDLASQELQSRRQAMVELVERLRGLEEQVRAHSARAEEKFRRRGQLLPRERLARLLDPGAPALELSSLAGLAMHDDDGGAGATGGGLVTAIGLVSGARCVVVAHDSAIKGGAVTPMGLRKFLRAQEIALVNKLPMVTLAESAGADLRYQAEIFNDGGRVFANMARLSAAGIPQVTVVHGSSTAGGAYMPGLSDYVVVVRGRAKIFLGGPPLVKAAIGEVATDEELGGADLHATVTGSAEYVAEDDAHAVALAREVMARIPWDRVGERERDGGPPFEEPRLDAEGLLAVAPGDFRRPYDVREVIARLVDGSDFLELKPRFGLHTVCGHGTVEGHSCGIIANNGPIDPRGAVKAAQFIQLCCQSGIPLVYLQNTTGYMVGTRAERDGMVKHGSKMIQAVANATVPQITFIIGGSFGAGNYGMCGRSFGPRFLFAWPNSRIAVMGGEQAAGVMETITRAKLARQGVEADEEALEAMRDSILRSMEEESSAFYATARVWDDGIIDPRDTRRILALALAVCREAETRTLRPTTFGVARM